MSKYFTVPHLPISQPASPIDYSGAVPDTPFLGVYAYDTVQRYVYGTRFLAWDGRVWKYCYASGAQYSYWGSASTASGVVSWALNPVEGQAGDTFATVTLTSRVKDDLAGGYYMLYDASATVCTMLFGILGNDATVTTTTKIYLDAPMPVASTTSDRQEVFENAWSEVYSCYPEANYAYHLIVGVPAANCSATYKFWCQTWGPAYISPGQPVDSPDPNKRLLRFSGNGCLYTENSVANGQIAGSIYNYGSSSIAGPVIYLMCST